jgi:hypothetical protein
LRISVVRRGLRIAATVLFVLSMIAAVANLFAAKNSAFVAFAFLAATVLYFVAPFSIVRHVGYRRTVDQETMLGALATYLFIGMALAFAYRLVGAAQASPFFGARGDGTVSQDGIVDAALLVDREVWPALERGVEGIARRFAGRMRLRLLGPIAPDDFTDERATEEG